VKDNTRTFLFDDISKFRNIVENFSIRILGIGLVINSDVIMSYDNNAQLFNVTEMKTSNTATCFSYEQVLNYVQSDSKMFRRTREICHDCIHYSFVIYLTAAHLQIVKDCSSIDNRKWNHHGLSTLFIPSIGSLITVQQDHFNANISSSIIIASYLEEHLKELLTVPSFSKKHQSCLIDKPGTSVQRTSAINYDEISYRINKMNRLHWKSIAMLNKLVEIHGYQYLFPFLFMPSEYASFFRHILHHLRDIEEILVENTNSSCFISFNTLVQIEEKIPILYNMVRKLYQEADRGWNSLDWQPQQIFALFGPYWLPLAIPGYKLLRYWQK